MIVQYGSVDVNQIPAGAAAVAGYVDGNYSNMGSLRARFPHAHILDIAVHAGTPARCLDVENGDATPDQAPGWLKTLALKDHGIPVLYTFASQVQTVVNVCAAQGLHQDKDYLLWSAHFQSAGYPHVCAPGSCGYPRANGTQWWDHGPNGENVDQSLMGNEFFGPPPPPPPPPDPHHYQRFATGPFPYNNEMLNERDVVEHYDGARKHSWKYRNLLKNDLEPKLDFLAKRIAYLAVKDHDWSTSWRWYRYQQLLMRSQGKQLVK